MKRIFRIEKDNIMIIKKVVSTYIGENGYIIVDEETNTGAIIDPGKNYKEFLYIIEENGYNIKYILLTHGHSDHIEGVPFILEKYDIPIVCHEEEVKYLENPNLNLSVILSHEDLVLKPDKIVKDGDTISVGNINIDVILTNGHTQGSVTYYIPKEKIAFTGDTLFRQSIGRTDFALGSERDIIDSIKNKLFVLDDDIIVYAGHGEDSTIGYEKKHNVVGNYNDIF